MSHVKNAAKIVAGAGVSPNPMHPKDAAATFQTQGCPLRAMERVKFAESRFKSMNKSEIAEKAADQLDALHEWEEHTGNAATCSEGNAFLDGYRTGRERAIAESQAPQPVVGMCARLKDEWFPLHQKPHKQLDNCLDWKPVSSETANRELGDGEPSPPPDDELFVICDRQPHLTHARNGHMVGECVNPLICPSTKERRSGAAQEVSPRQKAMQAAKEIESDCIEQSDEGYAFEVSRAAIIIEKLLGEEVSPPSPWRQGSKIPLNIYDGDRPICQTHTVADAKRIVESVNQGDTRELKAALRESAYLMSDKGFDELDVEEWDHRAKAIRDLAELLG